MKNNRLINNFKDTDLKDFKGVTCLYILKLNYLKKEIYKIGVTNNISRRIPEVAKDININKEEIKLVLIFKHPNIILLEQSLLRLYRKHVFYDIKNKYEFIEKDKFNEIFKERLLLAFKRIESNKVYINNLLKDFNYLYNNTRLVTFNSIERPSSIPILDKVLKENNLSYLMRCIITKRFLHKGDYYEIVQVKDTNKLFKNYKLVNEVTNEYFPEELKKKAELLRPLILNLKRQMTKEQTNKFFHVANTLFDYYKKY